ncbi:MAG: hypothetical protein WBD20_13945 [Pirellulaceae bacterium]
MPPTAEVDANSKHENTTQNPVTQNPISCAVTRTDPITGQSTIFAPKRGERPDQYRSAKAQQSDTAIGCPFCRGAESLTPAPVWIGRKTKADELGEIDHAVVPRSIPNTASMAHQAALARQTSLAHVQCIDSPSELQDIDFSDWLVRVVPNKYPAVNRSQPASNIDRKHRIPGRSKLFSETPVRGGHEVIVESPQHEESITALGTSNLALVFAAYRDRIGYWQGVDGIKYISAFKNCGGDAGASLAHSHSQIIATDIVPVHVREIVNRTAKYHAETGCCLQCDLVRAEIKEKSRIVAKLGPLIAYCPFASPMPMSVRITTQEHADRFDQFGDELIESIARLVKRVTNWIEQLLPGTAYNFLLNTRPPAANGAANSYHWSLDIFPRLSRIAGFEFSSHCMINSVMPEDAAASFQQCAANENPRGIR